MESKDEAAEERWDRLREEGEKSKKNKSGVPYNMINLMYVELSWHDRFFGFYCMITVVIVGRHGYTHTRAVCMVAQLKKQVLWHHLWSPKPRQVYVLCFRLIHDFLLRKSYSKE